MPNYSTQVTNVCDTMLNDISAIINNHPNSLCIFGGNIICNLHNKSNISSLISKFMFEHDLTFADHHLVSDNIMTYNHPTMDHSSYVNFILPCTQLCNIYSNHVTYDCGVNLSDHTAVKLKLPFDYKTVFPIQLSPEYDFLADAIKIPTSKLR